MNERFVHKPGCESTTVGTPQHVHSRRPEGGVCQCWCHPTPPVHGNIGQPPHTGVKRGRDCPECRAEGPLGSRWPTSAPAYLDRKGPHVPGTDFYDGEDGSIEDAPPTVAPNFACHLAFGPVTVITAEGTTTGYVTGDDRIVVDPADVPRLERATAKTLLEAAGYKVVGGSTVPALGAWDISIDEYPDARCCLLYTSPSPRD